MSKRSLGSSQVLCSPARAESAVWLHDQNGLQLMSLEPALALESCLLGTKRDRCCPQTQGVAACTGKGKLRRVAVTLAESLLARDKLEAALR